jgi:hypothetical protein
MALFEEPGADCTVNGLILFPLRDVSGAYCLARHGWCTWRSLETGMELAVKKCLYRCKFIEETAD